MSVSPEPAVYGGREIAQASVVDEDANQDRYHRGYGRKSDGQDLGVRHLALSKHPISAPLLGLFRVSADNEVPILAARQRRTQYNDEAVE